MKIYIEQSEIMTAIEKAEKLIHKASLKILETVLISATDNKITLTANNLTSGIIIEMDGRVEEQGDILIHKDNFKLLKKLSGRLYITDADGKIIIKANRELKFKQELSSDFPILKTDVNHEAFTIIENEFKDSLKIKIFASTEDYRPTLKACCINKNRIISLDGYRVAKIDLNINNECQQDIIIPIQSIVELDKILDKKSLRELKFEYFSETQNKKEEIRYIKICGTDKFFSKFQYITRVVEGEYMKVDNVIPNEFKFNIDIDKNVLNESVEFSKEILKEKQPVIFNLTNEFTISGTGEDKEFNETINSNTKISESDYIKYGYNPNFLCDIFKYY
jgi:DNA polymerase-3 subunit beta